VTRCLLTKITLVARRVTRETYLSGSLSELSRDPQALAVQAIRKPHLAIRRRRRRRFRTMADTPEQARVRAQLRERGNAVAPRTNPTTGDPEPASTPRATRAGRATERRAVVKGAVEGSEAGPVGVAAGAAKGRSKARKQARSSSTRARSRGSSRGRGPGIGKLSGPASGALFAEYFAGALIISFDLFTETPTKGYVPTISKVMMRLTALTAIFFVLFLMQGSKRGAQLAVWFGLLVDLGVVFTAARKQTFSTMSDIIGNKGTPAGAQLTSDVSGSSTGGSLASALSVPQTPPGTQLPDE
jgi:hypothetical protein